MHPVGFFLAGVLAARSRTAIEVFCYWNHSRPDQVTVQLRELADHWRVIEEVSDAEVEAMILKDGIDILVDLSGHTAENRLPLFARRPAPVQVSWLGYPSTTGLSAIDYLVMDATAVPPGAERWCSEKVARLPHGRFCYAPPDWAPDVADRSGSDPVIFGSFNNTTKLTPQVVRLWTEVLKASTGSRLVLKSKTLMEAAVRDRFQAAFAEAGLETGRLELRGLSPHQDMLAEYGGIDIALDPFPFCGGTTSCEALWMGVPVVTLPGERPASRQTLGFLRTLGLDGLVAQSEADYVRIATELAADADRRAALRRDLRPRMAASPLCDGVLFTASLEAAFRGMWLRWCAGEPPVSFDVPPGGTPS
jgi:predicted O-linked N-acetylglucosamine transferase (SPINDLY family)